MPSWRDEVPSSHLDARWPKMPMHDMRLTAVFIGLQIFGWVGFTLILWTVFLAKQITRHPVWINFCLTWLISCVSYVLLFLAGELNNPDPTHALCLIQACLIYAVPPMTACSTLALIIHLWFSVRSAVFKSTPKHQSIRDALLLLMPYVPLVVFFIGVLCGAMIHSTKVHLADCWMYCDMASPLPGKISASFVAGVLSIGVGLEIAIGTVLYHHWTTYTRSSRHAFAMIVRVILFTCFGLLAIVMSFIYLTHSKHGAMASLFLGLLPVFAVIIFGSQLDIFHTWFFCLSKPIVEEQSYRNPATRPLLLHTGSATSSASSLDIPPLTTEKAEQGIPSHSKPSSAESDDAPSRPPSSHARPNRTRQAGWLDASDGYYRLPSSEGHGHDDGRLPSRTKTSRTV